MRTFQINQLFGDLTPLETIGLAVSERRGQGLDWWRIVGSRSDLVSESVEILERFHLTDVIAERTAVLPYGKQRLLEIAVAIACRPRVLLLDEPAAGVPEDERHEILAAVAALPEDVTVLLIEHDMDIVFSFADRISVLVNGALFVEGTPEEVARDPRVKAVYLGEEHGRCLTLSERRTLVRRLRRGGRAEGRHLQGGRRPGAGAARPQRHGQDHAGQHDRRRHRAICGGSIRLDGHDITGLRPDQRAHVGIGWVPQERNIFKSLTVEENMTAIARPGPWTLDKVYAVFPRLAERRRNLGNQLSGGEQQMLAVARALILNPRIMLLDEPLEGLAPIIIEELLVVLRKIIREEKLSVILVEQNAHKILGVTDRAIILERGSIVHEGDSAALKADPALLETYVGVTNAGGDARKARRDARRAAAENGA